MNLNAASRNWLRRIGTWVGALNFSGLLRGATKDSASTDDDWDDIDGEMSDAIQTKSIGSAMNALDWNHVRADVDREARAHVLVIGARGAGKSTLLAQLIGADAETVTLQDADVETEVGNGSGLRIENFGFFALIDLPDGFTVPNGAESFDDETNALMTELLNADLVVWMLDGTRGLRNWEYAWLGRVRAMNKPLLVVVNKSEMLNERTPLERWENALGCELIEISAHDALTLKLNLLPRMADTTPHLATALGREVMLWRGEAAKRVMERAAALSGVMGLEPVPLLDLPFQILIQLQMVMRVAAIYGQPLNDRYSREMLATMLSAVGLRAAGQQAVKLVPIAGWVLSGALAAGGTWVLGKIAVQYFERGRRRGKRERENEREREGDKEAGWNGKVEKNGDENRAQRVEIGASEAVSVRGENRWKRLLERFKRRVPQGGSHE